MLRSLLCVIALISFARCEHEPVEISDPEFDQAFGGLLDDQAHELIVEDNAIYLVGQTKSFGNTEGEIYWIKTDLAGEKLAEQTFGPGVGARILAASDGTIWVAGTRPDAFGVNDVVLLQLNTMGSLLQELNFPEVANQTVGQLIQLANGNLALIGTNDVSGDRDIMLKLFSPSGDLLETFYYGDIDEEGGGEIIQLTDGGFMIFGYGVIPGNISRDYLLLRLNASFDSVWTKYYGGEDYEEAQALLQTPENDFLLVGHSASTDPIHDMYVVKVTSGGAVIWEKNYGGVKHDGGQAALINAKGQYVFMAMSMSFNENQNGYMVTTDKQGNTLKEEIIGGDGMDMIDAMRENNGAYYLVGYTSSIGAGGLDVYLKKTRF
jgi:hypothetical protein